MIGMKSSSLPYILFIALAAFPILLWAISTQNADTRSRADQGSLSLTPTATPSATLTPSITPSLTPTPTNVPPRCNGLSANPGAGPKPLTVSFACAGYDPDNDITAAEFGFGGDEKQLVEKSVGQFGSLTVTHTYTKAGTYHVTCRVRDNNMAYSTYPNYCQYTIVVTENVLTPTPYRTPIPTPTIAREDTPIIFPGSFPSVTPTAQPTAALTPTVTPTPTAGFWSNEKIAQLVMMIMVSGITIIVALLLHGFFERR